MSQWKRVWSQFLFEFVFLLILLTFTIAEAILKKAVFRLSKLNDKSGTILQFIKKYMMQMLMIKKYLKVSLKVF